MSLCHRVNCITVSLYHCVTVSRCHCITVSLYHCVTVSPCHCITVSLYHCVTVSPCNGITISLHHYITVLHYCCFATLVLFERIARALYPHSTHLPLVTMRAAAWLQQPVHLAATPTLTHSWDFCLFTPFLLLLSSCLKL